MFDTLATSEISLKARGFEWLTQQENEVREGLESFIRTGEKILEIRDSELWRLRGVQSWDEYCKRTWNFGRSRASQLITGAKTARRIQDVIGVTVKHERDARAMNSLLQKYPDSVQDLALDALSKRGGELTTARLKNELEVLSEYRTTGHVTRADGEQSALDSAIKTGRREIEVAKREYLVQGIEIEAKVNPSREWELEIGVINIDFNYAPLFKDAPRKVHVSVWIEQEY